MVYNNFSRYLKEKYGCKVAKICIDGGFTCPNRDGTCGYGGCIFCGERGAGEHITNSAMSITEQVREFFLMEHKADAFIAYFQNFTNTYGSVEVLKEKYDAALINDSIVALAVGTRPDCISEEIAQLLSTYQNKYDVWVELGLQTSNDRTAELINRGYDHSVFTKAVSILNRWNIPVVVHIILGLPGETISDVQNTVNFLNQHKLWGIKVHSIYVMKNTALEEMYLKGDYAPPTLDEYVEEAVYVLTHIPATMIVHRLTGDCPKDMLVAPDWNLNKNIVIQKIVENMEDHNWVQGVLYCGSCK